MTTQDHNRSPACTKQSVIVSLMWGQETGREDALKEVGAGLQNKKDPLRGVGSGSGPMWLDGKDYVGLYKALGTLQTLTPFISTPTRPSGFYCPHFTIARGQGSKWLNNLPKVC